MFKRLFGKTLLVKALERIPLLKRLPLVRLLLIGELIAVARRHWQYLSATERRRLTELARRPRSLTPAERGELKTLARRLEPRAFAGTAIEQLSPVPLPKRLTRGSRRRG